MKTYKSFLEIREEIKNKNLTCRKLVNYYLDNIRKNKHLNVYLEVYDQEALSFADLIDEKLAQGTAGKLAGMVIGIKDVFCHKDHRLQASSNILDSFISQFNGTAIQRLLDEDAIIIGRQNCDEFAMGSSNENSAFGPTLNAADISRVPGGSSGASAVAVQADTCLVSLGSDTGGSVRQPAAFCGVVGMKPTYSRISRHGLIAYSSSFDCIGIFSKNIEDNALVLETIAGKDEFDSTVSQKPVPEYSKLMSLPNRKMRIAYINDTLDAKGVDKEISKQTKERLDWLKSQGHDVELVEFPLMDYLLPTYYILTTAESSSNLSRYDGVRYGLRSKETTDLESMYKKTRSEGFGKEVKRRIMLGTFVLSASYYDDYYTKAQQVRYLIRENTKSILTDFDFLILPTTPTTAFKLGDHTKDPLEMYLADLFTVQSSIAGTPAISIPNGVDSNGLPIGLQILANDFKESDLFAFSKYLMEQS